MTKSSDTKGFWEAVACNRPPVAAERSFLSATGSCNSPLRDAYIGVAKSIRNMWRDIPGKRGPGYIAVTLCADENEYGLTDSSGERGVGRRWACNTCYGFAPSVWADGQVPTRENQEQEWADWAAKQTPRTDAGKWRTKLRDVGVLPR